MRKIILASQSPRRKELLSKMGLTFTVIPSNFEEHLDNSRSPEEVAIELALGKAMDVAKQYPDAIVIGSDTIVTIDGQQLEKPKDNADAKYLLSLLAGKTNQITSSLAVVCIDQNITLTDSDTVNVQFKAFDEVIIDNYIATGDAMDKAGAYGMQSGAAPLIEHYTGRGDTAMGLPTHILANILTDSFGISAVPANITLPVRRAN